VIHPVVGRLTSVDQGKKNDWAQSGADPSA
jgi:hypothetical protein